MSYEAVGGLMNKIQIFFFIVFMIFSHIQLNAQPVKIQLSASAVSPSGDSGDYWNMGYSLGVNVMIPMNSFLLLGKHISYTWFTINENNVAANYASPKNLDISGTYSLLEFIPFIRAYIGYDGERMINFFLQVGGGIFYNSTTIDVSGTAGAFPVNDSVSQAQANPGISFGIGIILGESDGMKIELFPQYQFVFADGETIEYFNFGFGFIF